MVAEAEAELGAVTAILHGAGRNEPAAHPRLRGQRSPGLDGHPVGVAPVRGCRHQRHSAVSTVVQAGSALPAALVPAVQAAARGISRTLRKSAVDEF